MNVRAYARKSAQIIFGVGLAQLIALALIPIVTRLYSPVEFSGYSNYLYVTSLAATILVFRFDNTLIPIKFSAKRSLAFAYFVTFYSWVFVGLCIVFLFYYLSFEASPENVNVLVFVIGAVATAVFQFAMGGFVSQSAYKKINYLRVVQAGALGTFQIGFALVELLHSLGLMLGDALSRLAALVMYRRLLGRTAPMRLLRGFYAFRRVVRPLLGQSAFSTFSTLLSTASLLSPIFFLGLFVEDKAGVALFLLSYKLLAIPVSLISRSMAQVFLGEGQKLGDEVGKAVRSVLVINLAVALLVCAVVLLAAPWVEPALGRDWTGAASYVRALVPLTFGQMLLLPVVQVYILKNRNQEILWWEIFRFTLVHLSVYVAYLVGVEDSLTLILVYSFAMGGAYLMLLARVLRVG